MIAVLSYDTSNLGSDSLRKTFLGSIILLYILVGCNQENSSNWYETKEKAIEYGLEQEEVDKSAVLSIEEYEGETIVFYERAGSLGVASISENNKGYSWYRSEPYLGFDIEGDIPYTSNGFNYGTESGLELSVLYGKVFDNSIQSLKLSSDGTERELEIFGNSRLFYAIHRQPFTSIEITPIKDESLN